MTWAYGCTYSHCVASWKVLWNTSVVRVVRLRAHQLEQYRYMHFLCNCSCLISNCVSAIMSCRWKINSSPQRQMFRETQILHWCRNWKFPKWTFQIERKKRNDAFLPTCRGVLTPWQFTEYPPRPFTSFINCRKLHKVLARLNDVFFFSIFAAMALVIRFSCWK